MVCKSDIKMHSMVKIKEFSDKNNCDPYLTQSFNIMHHRTHNWQPPPCFIKITLIIIFHLPQMMYIHLISYQWYETRGVDWYTRWDQILLGNNLENRIDGIASRAGIDSTSWMISHVMWNMKLTHTSCPQWIPPPNFSIPHWT